ncbi:MAG: hypothetical protein Q7V20_16935 [Aquabacterium sp.]|uniref:hypothetical protein n=1 Tax=Aquabacterium sp. TaxID=1872578 RepID=UPI00271B03CE|nr:hypothetical protein [Aquabacterium sp.]MDO9005132.1 hypothetical protein [Aquabacterium sp.]
MTGPNSEQDISNEQFLNSYLDYGCWLRVVTSRQQLDVIENKNSSELQKLAALASFYQTAGLVVEDALSMHIAWSLWQLDKSKSLPDILERLSLRLSSPKGDLPESYASDIKQKYITTKKRVDIYPRQYLNDLLSLSDEELPATFGINWKRHPSVKLVPPELRLFWNNLGHYIRGCVEPLASPKGALLASCYNKIKHGPQLTIMAPAAAAKYRGFEYPDVEHFMQEPTIRLLLQGSRTQETPEETQANERVAPFLVADAPNMRRWFFQQIAHTSNALYINGTWIFNTTYIDRKRPFKIESPELLSIISEQGTHLNRTFNMNIE